jgi:rubrerythrin
MIGYMKQVYSARDPMDARFVQGLLNREGIEAAVEGEELPEPTGVALPTVWVRDQDVAQAEPIIEEYRQREATRAQTPEPARATWTCPACGEIVEDQFTNCWKCGTARPG